MKFLFIFSSFIFSTVLFYAQDTTFSDKYASPEIIYAGQFPADDSGENKFDKILNFISGKKNENILKPFSITKDGNNNLWYTDQGLSSVVRIDGNKGHIPRYIENKNYQFLTLVDICKFQGGEILFTDSEANKVYALNENNKEIHDFLKDYKLNRPTGIAYCSETKKVYISETGSHCITVCDENGKFLRKIGKRGSKAGEFNYPTFIYIDKLGIIYVIDSMNFRIQLFDKNGEFLNTFGEQGNGTGYFAAPKGVATDSKGNIYIVDALFHAVQIFDKEGNFLYSFGSQGTEKGKFWMPTGIFIDEKDKIYVADCYNSRIQIFELITNKE